MSSAHFTHLHLHSDYSLLDGAISIDSLIKFGKEHSCKALAITDHGNVFSAVKFFERCKKEKIKPILGMESYITTDITIKNKQNRSYHLLLIVQNAEGYKNLCKLIAASYTKGFYSKPRIDYALLEKHHAGLIATSTCVGGHIPQLILNDKAQEAEALIDRMKSIFGDRFYFEVQPGEFSEQIKVNETLFSIEKKYNIPIIATADCHYPSKEDRYAHEVMLAIQTKHTMEDKDRMTFGEFRAHMRTPEEMCDAFSERNDVVWRTGEVADRCDFSFVTGKLFFPQFTLPEGYDSINNFFTEACQKGFETLLTKNKIPLDAKSEYQKRLDEEIAMIITMGFPTYLLVVSDFIQWAKNQGIPVGAGRGSVAGSLVAWALAITDVDPIKYHLLFERFLNPERVSNPDVDVDLCINGRERVIQYVKEKYGHDNVCQIVTFGTMMARGVVKDVARALGFSFEDANMITALIPDELKITLQESLEREPRLKQFYENNPKIKELFDIAFRLEGLVRHASKHAAGIVISPEPITEVLPIYAAGGKSEEIVTQYAMTELESLGFLKMDFLGLQNITLIDHVVKKIKKTHGVTIDITEIPLDDAKTIALIAEGKTNGVFQLESNGIKDVLQRLHPTCFEEVIALNALYRPGPLESGMVDDFIERKNGRETITYIFPELAPILEETFGVIVYQEQVMKIASVIAGYSLGEADILRRAMGKKKAEVMDEQRSIFSQRAKERGFDKEKAESLFNLMAHFAGYGFNKSHSTAYALIAYQTAYLKVHYPVEFLATLITLELSHPEKSVLYLKEARDMNIPLLPPDIRFSDGEFCSEGGAIRFGLLGIKNLGNAALQSIITARAVEKNMHHIISFLSAIDLRVCNKRVIEHLIFSGALDCFGKKRETLLENIDLLITMAEQHKKKTSAGQMGLFDEYDEEKNDFLVPEPTWNTKDTWSIAQKLEKEKEVLGIYLSEHPLDEPDALLLPMGTMTLAMSRALAERDTQKRILTRGTITSIREVRTKKGDLMAFGTVEDQQESAELIVFPKIYALFSDALKKHTTFLIEGSGEFQENKLKIKANALIPLAEFHPETQVHTWHIHVKNNDHITELTPVIHNNKSGKQHLVIHLSEGNTHFAHHLNESVTFTKDTITSFFANKECYQLSATFHHELNK